MQEIDDPDYDRLSLISLLNCIQFGLFQMQTQIFDTCEDLERHILDCHIPRHFLSSKMRNLPMVHTYSYSNIFPVMSLKAIRDLIDSTAYVLKVFRDVEKYNEIWPRSFKSSTKKYLERYIGYALFANFHYEKKKNNGYVESLKDINLMFFLKLCGDFIYNSGNVSNYHDPINFLQLIFNELS